MKVIFNKFLYVVFFFIFSINILTAAPVNDTLNFISDKLYVSIQEVGNYEIDQINFIGNSFFSKEELSEYVSSKSSNISFAHQRLLNIYKQLKINNSVISKYLIPKVETALKSFKSEYSYFNQEVAVLDIDILKYLQENCSSTGTELKKNLYYKLLAYRIAIAKERNNLYKTTAFAENYGWQVSCFATDKTCSGSLTINVGELAQFTNKEIREIKKIEMLHDSVISFLSYYPQGMKTSISKFTVAKICEQPVSTKI